MDLVKIFAYRTLIMVSELDKNVGQLTIAEHLALRLQTILNQWMNGYVHRADCYYSKNEVHSSSSIFRLKADGKQYEISVKVNKIKANRVKDLLTEKS